MSFRNAKVLDYASPATSVSGKSETPRTAKRVIELPAPRLHRFSLSDERFVQMYSSVLYRMCDANAMSGYLPDKHDAVSIFFSTFTQPFKLESYISRIVTFSNCSRSVFVNALIYLERIKRVDSRLAICDMNIHRVFMISIVLSVKFLEDELYPNSYFSKVGGIQTVAEFVSHVLSIEAFNRYCPCSASLKLTPFCLLFSTCSAEPT
jgi:hypothetical protein